VRTARDWLGLLRLEDGRKWVEAAHGWQRDDALAVLEGDQPYGFYTRARGGSKTTDLSAAMLSVLLASQDRLRCFWLAADGRQGELAVDCISGFVSRTPGLEGRLEVQARKVLVRATGASLEIMPADASGAWGLTPHWLFVDELANWGDTAAARRLWEAASSAVAKRPDARMAVLTTASTPDHFSFKVLEHARTSPLWRVSEREGPAPWMSEDRLEEQRARLPLVVYEQLFENRWTSAAGSFLDPAVIAAAFALDGPALERGDNAAAYAAGLDLGTVNDRTAFALGHRDGDRMLLDRMETWRGSRKRPVDFAQVEEFVVMAHRRFGFKLRLDPWQGLDMAQRLRARGVQVDEYTFSTSSKQRLAATLLSAINSGNLLMYDAEGLRDELLALRLVQTTAGAWAFDHARGGHDDRAVALALVAVALLGGPQVGVSAPVFGTRDPWWGLLTEKADGTGRARREPRPMGSSPRREAPAEDAGDGGSEPDGSDIPWSAVDDDLKRKLDRDLAKWEQARRRERAVHQAQRGNPRPRRRHWTRDLTGPGWGG
jgi:hypothetical protein